MNDKRWIRSGKTDNFSKSHKDHRKKTNARFTTGKIYMCYPSKARNGTSAGWSGSFEDLKMYRAIGFVAGDGEAIKRMVETGEDSMFVLDKYNINKITKINMRGGSM